VTSLLIALVSIGLQLAAAYHAFRLIRTSGRHPGWIALTAGLVLMALRRAVELRLLIGRGLDQASLAPGELIGVGNATLLFLGTLGIKSYFVNAQRNAQALKESEARSRAVLDALPDICFRLASDGTVLFFDPKDHSTSLDPDRAVGMRIEDSGVSPELADFLRQLLRDTLRERHGLLREVELVLRGEPRVREVRTNPSGPDEVLFLVRDITEQKRFEEARRREEGLHRAILDVNPDPVYFKDGAGIFRQCNQAFCEGVLGLPLGEVLGRTEAELTEKTTPTLLGQADRAAMEARKPGCTEELVPGPDGAVKVLEVARTPLLDEQGNLLGIVGVGRDITHRKELEERLQDQLAFGEVLLDAIPLPVFFKDRSGRYLGCNPAFADFLGRTRSEITGSLAGDLFRPDQAARFREADEELFQRGGLQVFEGSMWHAGMAEDREVRIIKATFGGEGQARAGMVGVMEDITERKRNEETLRAAQKMESLGLMAGGIAHDFNNLLQAIQGNLEVAQLLGFQEGAPGQALERALGSVAKAAELAKRMLEYAGRVGGAMEPLDLAHLLREREIRLGALLPPKAKLRMELPAAACRVEGNGVELAQVLAALVTNAGEALDEAGGEVVLALAAHRLERRELQEGFWVERPPEGASYRLEIRDTGMGIGLRAQSRIFDPFFTTKEAGRGLGLPSALGILRAHRAGLQVLSAEGQGSIFRIFFAALEAVKEESAEAAGPGPGSGGAILLVDDEPVVREGLAELIRRGLGREVFEAQNGEAALALLDHLGARIGFVIMDATMPGESGMEVFERIRRIRPEMQGLLCSGYSGTFGQEAAAQHGFAGFLAKPFGIRELKKSLEGLLPPLEAES